MEDDYERSIFELLAHEHREIEAQFAQIQQLGPSHLDDARDLYRGLARLIVSHFEAEARVVYPRFATFPDLAAILDGTSTDHARIAHLAKELSTQQTTASEWLRAVRRLEADVEQHLEAEEADLFPAARRALSMEESHALASDFRRPEPFAVHASAP